MNIHKRLGVSIMVICIVLSCSVPAFAYERTAEEMVADMTANEVVNVLINSGYPESTAKVLPENRQREIAQALLENPELVDVSSTIMEVDNLAEIEAFFTYTDEQLIEMGGDPLAIEVARQELCAMYEKDAAALSKELNISETEASMILRAIEKGLENANSDEIISKKSGVNASGSIDSSEMTYTQSAQHLTQYTTPYYLVDIVYTWNEIYALGIFNDKIATTWGGNLNIISNTSTAYYYTFDTHIIFATDSMSVEDSPNVSRVYAFPQSKTISNQYGKTESGYASFILYQTQTQGYDTVVVSRYGHRVISIGGDVTFSVSPISVSFGTAYDYTTQRSSIISY